MRIGLPRVPSTWQERIPRFVGFGLVGMTGLVVNQVALWWFTEIVGLHYLASAVVATQLSTTWNFMLVELFVFRGQRGGRLVRFWWFLAMNDSWLLVRGPLLVVCTEVFHVNYLVSNAIVLCLTSVARFAIADGLIWKRQEAEADGEAPVALSLRHPRHRAHRL